MQGHGQQGNEGEGQANIHETQPSTGHCVTRLSVRLTGPWKLPPLPPHLLLLLPLTEVSVSTS